MSTNLLDDLEQGERLKSLGIEEETAADIAEVVSQRAWFDSNGCDQNFHLFKRAEKGIEVFHLDSKPCDLSEYYLPLDNLGRG